MDCNVFTIAEIERIGGGDRRAESDSPGVVEFQKEDRSCRLGPISPDEFRTWQAEREAVPAGSARRIDRKRRSPWHGIEWK